MIYVRQARALRIATTQDQPEYRPGERATLKFTLTDQQGRPAPGALSLAAVDEAVFSVLQPLPGLRGAFSALEEQLLKPVYQIYDWYPDFASRGSGLAGGGKRLSAVDRQRFEQGSVFRRDRRCRREQLCWRSCCPIWRTIELRSTYWNGRIGKNWPIRSRCRKEPSKCCASAGVRFR